MREFDPGYGLECWRVVCGLPAMICHRLAWRDSSTKHATNNSARVSGLRLQDIICHQE